MKHGIAPLIFGALALSTAAVANAGVSVQVGINPFAFGGYPPPVVYQPYPYYAPPPVVYLGGGSWAGDRGARWRSHERRDRRR
jgi:hypothetical protein